MSKADWRIVQFKTANEACSKKMFEEMEEERQDLIKNQEMMRTRESQD